jgi:hypothetical protein
MVAGRRNEDCQNVASGRLGNLFICKNNWAKNLELQNYRYLVCGTEMW